MLKSELKSLWKNKLLIVIVLAIILIPSIYAGLFLSSMWDPYGDLEYLPVAVVNKDKPVTYQGKELAVGDTLAENLEENDAMAFNIVDEDVAMKGLKNGTYYMVITIPEDFSKNATTVMDEEPVQMKLEYTTNPGKNYISMKLGESAMKTIQSNITEQVTRTYTENVFDSLTDIESGFCDATDGTQDMLDGEEKLAEGNNLITGNLLLLSDGANALQKGTGTLSKGAHTLNDSMGQLTSGAGELAGGIGQYTDGVGQLAAGIGTLKNGTGTLAESVPALTKGVGDLKTGADKLAKAYEGEEGALNGASALADGMSQVNQAVSNISLPSVSLSDEQKSAITNQASATVDAQAGTIKTQAEAAVTEQKDTIIAQATAAANAQVSSTGAEAKAALIAAGKDASQNEAAVYISQLQTGMDQLIASTATLTADMVASQASDGTAASSVNSQAIVNEVLTSVQSDQGYLAVQNGISDAIGGSFAAGYGSGTVANAGTIAYSAVLNASGDIALSAARAAAGSGALAGAEGVVLEVNQNMNSFGSQLDSLKDATQRLASGSKQLSGGLNQIYAGTKQVDDGLATLNSKSGVLAAGVGQLDSGAGSLLEGVTKLTSNSNALKTGATGLSEGTIKVADAVTQIADGSDELDLGASRIADGAKQLQNGSQQLGDGLEDLKEGTTTLHDALADGANRVAENKAEDNNLDMFSAPVELVEHNLTTVENNGHGMAAYMMSVGLWVGCLAFCLMYPLTKYHGKFKNGFSWWLSKAAVAAPVGILMVIVLMMVMSIFLDFTPGSMIKTVIVATVAVTAFMCIQYFFDIVFGKVGSFLMLIFMVLQLTGSAGTYPIEISGHLAQVLHKWMPFTYSVNGFRAAIAAGDTEGILFEVEVLAGIAIVFTILTILVFEFRGRCIEKNKKMLYDWIEEKGLA
ncbi:MAG: YhgE/Pip family protein [Lachnospiraceae bacterium]